MRNFLRRPDADPPPTGTALERASVLPLPPRPSDLPVGGQRGQMRHECIWERRPYIEAVINRFVWGNVRIATPLEWAVLCNLYAHDSDATYLDVAMWIESELKLPFSASSLRNALLQLESAGLIERGKLVVVTGKAGRNRLSYRITPNGINMLRSGAEANAMIIQTKEAATV